jgi:hypothetical protein
VDELPSAAVNRIAAINTLCNVMKSDRSAKGVRLTDALMKVAFEPSRIRPPVVMADTETLLVLSRMIEEDLGGRIYDDAGHKGFMFCGIEFKPSEGALGG